MSGVESELNDYGEQDNKLPCIPTLVFSRHRSDLALAPLIGMSWLSEDMFLYDYFDLLSELDLDELFEGSVKSSVSARSEGAFFGLFCS